MRVFRNYRKGILVPETLGIVIALIGLVALAFFGGRVYNMFVEQDMKNAQAFVDGLSSKIENLGDGESNTFALRGVEGWVLVGWNKSVPIAEDDKLISADLKPQKCFDKNCLCLCEEKITNCQENGYCRAMDRNVKVENAYGAIDKSWSLIINCYFFNDESLVSLNVRKNSNEILIGNTPVYASYMDDFFPILKQSDSFSCPKHIIGNPLYKPTVNPTQK